MFSAMFPKKMFHMGISSNYRQGGTFSWKVSEGRGRTKSTLSSVQSRLV